MSDNTEQPGGGPAARDPWAPPDSKVELGKPTTGATGPPAVHDQPTVTSMPNAGTGPIPTPGPGGFGPPSADVPAPPIAPNGPGPAAPPAGQYGYPAPVAPAAPYPGYAGYPGYSGQPGWAPGPANGLGIAAMVLGIVGVVGFCMYGLGVILGVLALIFGIIGRGRAKRGEATNDGMALAGIVLGSVAIAISAVFLGFIIWAISSADSRDVDFDYSEPYSTSLVVDATR